MSVAHRKSARRAAGEQTLRAVVRSQLRVRAHFASLVLALASLAAGSTGVAAPPAAIERLDAPYEVAPRAALQERLEQLARTPGALPILVESEQGEWRVRGDVYSLIEQPFEQVRDALEVPARWCELLPLHLNVKACTHTTVSGAPGLVLYLGRKHYQTPEQARRLELSFEVVRSSSEALDVVLQAETGPMGTRDYALSLSAQPLSRDRSLIHFAFSHGYGVVSKVAMFGYLRTLGRHKVGFSAAGHDAEGRPILVGGEQGMIERNAMRYQLAIQAYLDTLELPAAIRFERRLERSFELTLAWPEQLFELERAEYVDSKRREWANQSALQHEPSLAGGR